LRHDNTGVHATRLFYALLFSVLSLSSCVKRRSVAGLAV